MERACTSHPRQSPLASRTVLTFRLETADAPHPLRSIVQCLVDLRLSTTARTTGAPRPAHNFRSHTPDQVSRSNLARKAPTRARSPRQKVIITNIDLSEEVVDVASAALERYNIEKDIAAQFKEFRTS